MKCAQCGYYNLPGATVCGRCGLDPAAAAADIPADLSAPLYPPRARERPLAARLRGHVGLGDHSARLRAIRAQSRRGGARWEPEMWGALRSQIRPWLIVSASLLPGLGQFWQGRARRGLVLLGSGGALLIFASLWLRSPLSDVLLWGFFGLMCVSVWDAAWHGFPPAAQEAEARLLGAARLGLLSAGLIFGFFATIFALIGPWYSPWEVAVDLAPPVLRQGDGMLVERMAGNPLPHLHRGDVIISRGIVYGNHYQGTPIAERILGLPGDQIACGGGTIVINGKPLASGRLPLTFRPPVPASAATVPPNDVCLWRTAIPQEGDEPGVSRDPLVILPATEVEGRVIAIYEPPARRQWVR